MKKVSTRIVPVIFVVTTLIMAGILLWSNSKITVQSWSGIYPKVIFQGEYKIGDGQWQEYRPGVHIPVNQGEIILRGILSKKIPMIAEDLGTVIQGDSVAFYSDHIMVEIREEGLEPVILESELPSYDFTCAKIWHSYIYRGEKDGEIEICIKSPHKFGNTNAVDELLENMYLYAGYEFEEDRVKEGNLQRLAGLVILLGACCMLGIYVFAGRIHIRGNHFLGIVAFLIIFAGGYFVLSSPNVNLWKSSNMFNTTALGVCMMLYQYLITLLVTYVLGRKTKKIAQSLVFLSGALPLLGLLITIASNLHFYATWGIWAFLESLVSMALIFCVCYDMKEVDYHVRLMQTATTAPLLSFVLDVFATAIGWWQGGKASMLVFSIYFLAVFIIVVRIIPQKINEAARAKELEEKQRELQQELKDRRVSVMMSQIRTHFIFNVMTIISGLCNSDPLKADDALILFARYLRKNMDIMDRDEPIFFTQELHHLEDYISLEKMRFGDKIKFEKNLQITDFKIPPLTIQPLVENAIKHGLLASGKKGTVTLSSKEEEDRVRITIEDDGIGFILEDLEKKDAVGIRNVRYRVENMVGGRLEMISTPEKGTKAVIFIPRNNNK